MVVTRDFLMNDIDVFSRIVSDEIFDNSRWSIHHRIVFEWEGKHYYTCYSCGATEMQDESPWEYENEIVCFEVELREVVVQKWVPVEEGE